MLTSCDVVLLDSAVTLETVVILLTCFWVGCFPISVCSKTWPGSSYLVSSPNALWAFLNMARLADSVYNTFGFTLVVCLTWGDCLSLGGSSTTFFVLFLGLFFLSFSLAIKLKIIKKLTSDEVQFIARLLFAFSCMTDWNDTYANITINLKQDTDNTKEIKTRTDITLAWICCRTKKRRRFHVPRDPKSLRRKKEKSSKFDSN